MEYKKMMSNLTLEELSIGNSPQYSGIAFFRSNTVLSKVKTTVWRCPFSHVGLVYRSSSYDGVPRYTITYMDEIEGLSTKPLVQFVLEQPLLQCLEIRPLFLSKSTAMKYSLAKHFDRQGTMENFDKEHFQTELAGMFSLDRGSDPTSSSTTAAITNLDFVLRTLLDAEIITLEELSAGVPVCEEEVGNPMVSNSIFQIELSNAPTRLVNQLFQLMGLEPKQEDLTDDRCCFLKNILYNSYKFLENGRYRVILPDISPDNLAVLTRERLEKDRQCSSTFLSAMFETTLAENILLNHVTEELCTTSKARVLHKEVTEELVGDLAEAVGGYMKLVQETYRERSSSAEVYRHDSAMSKVMETLGSLILLHQSARIHLHLYPMGGPPQ